MQSIGTAKTASQQKIMLLGSGELGKEFAIAAQHLGIYIIAVDRYDNAPAMHVAHEAAVIDMQNTDQLKRLIQEIKPDYIVPEIEAIATDALVELEKQGFKIIPCAKAVQLTMDREGIRKLASDKLDLKTSEFRFADTYKSYLDAIELIGLPCVIKPLMSSSGKGQSILQNKQAIDVSWQYAQEGARGHSKRVIVEKFIPFDSEITLLTIRHPKEGTLFCDPIGHIQVKGDYRLSWQPHIVADEVIKKAQVIAKQITEALGGYGVFGVELFIKDNEVYFNEVSPRPHDTGMVTLCSQNINEFELHLRAILGLPVGEIKTIRPGASAAILLEGNSDQPQFGGIEDALCIEESDIRLFAKPNLNGLRRMGVALALADTVDQAKERAKNIANSVTLMG
ncbi:formate-dependent phosphoribosylglycinamide formyltransferase [Thiotrichales bacterium 19S3-7]|nr:formate-dependent phosphoribosylglycinamide formyltransferase [Thiotrichales bacterium 19S3-7]MCF6802115.1 formate-dependent phosphoribosylglycinamide formyltransferase [Thiotrichales bacterium 19S3-11]